MTPAEAVTLFARSLAKQSDTPRDIMDRAERFIATGRIPTAVPRRMLAPSVMVEQAVMRLQVTTYDELVAEVKRLYPRSSMDREQVTRAVLSLRTRKHLPPSRQKELVHSWDVEQNPELARPLATQYEQLLDVLRRRGPTAIRVLCGSIKNAQGQQPSLATVQDLITRGRREGTILPCATRGIVEAVPNPDEASRT